MQYTYLDDCMNKETKVLLLHPPITLKKEDVSTFGFYPPLGLGYIASVLLKDNYTVDVFDILVEGKDHIEDVGNGMVRLGLSREKIKEVLETKKPTIVGLTNSFFSFSDDSGRLAQIVREVLPDAFIIIGGAATTEVKRMLSNNVIDCVIVGEAEYIFRDLVSCVSQGNLEKARKITGTVWHVGKEIITNPERELIQDLDSIPFPAYHLLDLEKYIWQKHANYRACMRWPVAHMVTSRGCVYNCIFCSTTRYFQKFRARSIENVVEEMKLLIREYGIREFHFHDDYFMSNKKRIEKFCTMIIHEKMNITWQVSQGINIPHVDEELLELMQRSGMYRVGFPIESGCPETLKYMRKPMQLDKALRLIKKANELGLYTFGCFLIGFPEETKEQIQQTIDFIMASGLDYPKISIVQPHYGTDLFSVYQQLGLLDKETGNIKHGSTYFHTTYNTKYLKASELNAVRMQALTQFGKQRMIHMLTPTGIKRFILPKIKTFEGARYFIRMGYCFFTGSFN
jgi:magnesium-protoporphyrin IX monomethyl ester (oxidative) cyclase